MVWKWVSQPRSSCGREGATFSIGENSAANLRGNGSEVVWRCQMKDRWPARIVFLPTPTLKPKPYKKEGHSVLTTMPENRWDQVR
jgi:hypothetical protein